jgi:uncharacterized membrane-anchored protein
VIKKILLGCIAAISMQTFSSVCFAEDAQTTEPEKEMTAEQFLASLHFQKGNITLPNNVAVLNLPASFRYLPPADAERVLVDAWGNPPGYESLGMIFPADRSPLDENSWGVVITYDEDGHVKDDDALSIKYDEILADMKKQSEENNEDRKKDGYPAMTLVGWAEPPRYDSGAHKFYWAKELAVEGSDANTLNYNIRVLGRKGVLVLNAIAGMNQVSEIREQMPTVVAATEFTNGNRYADFDSGTDKVAEYGLAALLAGGVAAKLGLFGKLFAMLLVFKKFIVVGALALGSFITKFFKKK